MCALLTRKNKKTIFCKLFTDTFYSILNSQNQYIQTTFVHKGRMNQKV